MTNVQNTTEFKKLTFWERNKLSGGYLLQKVVMERAVSIRVEFYSKDQLDELGAAMEAQKKLLKGEQRAA